MKVYLINTTTGETQTKTALKINDLPEAHEPGWLVASTLRLHEHHVMVVSRWLRAREAKKVVHDTYTAYLARKVKAVADDAAETAKHTADMWNVRHEAEELAHARHEAGCRKGAVDDGDW